LQHGLCDLRVERQPAWPAEAKSQLPENNRLSSEFGL
jgi:hypothetical protein